MNAECIIRQSVMQSNMPFQQLSNLILTGVSTKQDLENTDRGLLYGSLTLASSTYTLQLYKDSTKLDLVASGTASALGPINLNAQNASGLSGTVNLAQYAADDALIEIRCLYSVDSDLPMDNLEGLSDYDETVGFADMHIRAFQKVNEIITSRYRSLLWNSSLIDTRAINGGLGGFDLSRFNNLEVLRDPSRYYAFMLLCERQTVEPDSIFAGRQKESRGLFKAHMESVELTFDLTNQRLDEKARTLSTFKMSRA